MGRVKGALVAQWIALAAHGQWVVGWNPISVIGGVRKVIRLYLLLCSRYNLVPRPAQKKPTTGFLTGLWGLKTDMSWPEAREVN